MPIVQIDFLAGRTQEQKEAMMMKVTEAICETLNAPPDSVRIILHEHTTDEISIGGKTMKQLGR